MRRRRWGTPACRAGYTVLFTKTSALLRDLAGGRADGSWEPRLRKYLQSDVLILDDFGMREFTSTQAEDLYELICGRYRAGSMMVTSNRPPTDWYTLFPNAVLAESALDRLVNSAHHVIFRGARIARCAVRIATRPATTPWISRSETLSPRRRSALARPSRRTPMTLTTPPPASTPNRTTEEELRAATIHR